MPQVLSASVNVYNDSGEAEVEIIFSTASDKMSGIYENPSDIFENSPDKTLLTNMAK